MLGLLPTVVPVGIIVVGLLSAGSAVRMLLGGRKQRQSWERVPGRVVRSRLEDNQLRCQVAYVLRGREVTFWNRYSSSFVIDPVGREGGGAGQPGGPAGRGRRPRPGRVECRRATVPVLNGVLDWVEAGTPKYGPVPADALHAVHPQPKAEKPARKPSATYLRALADVRRVLAEKGDLDAFLTEHGA